MASLGLALGLIASTLSFAMAAFVLWPRAGRTSNRWLAVLLFFEATAHLFVVEEILDGTPSRWGVWMVHLVSVVVLPWIYLAFLGALSTPLTRWLGSPRGRWTMMAGAVGSTALVMARPGWFLEGPAPRLEGGVGLEVVYIVFALVNLFGLAAAISALRRASEGTVTKDRARAFVRAFGVRDGLYAVGLLVPWWIIMPESLGAVTDAIYAVTIEGATIGFVVLMGYGILETQLFDIDLKLKWTIKQGTVAAVFVAVFFAVSEGAQVVFADAAGSELWGVAAAALLVLAISPLQRMAGRLADQAMPGVQASTEYEVYRKLRVYRSTVESLWEDGGLSAKERATLDRLREELGIDGAAADQVDREVEQHMSAG